MVDIFRIKQEVCFLVILLSLLQNYASHGEASTALFAITVEAAP